MLLPRRIVHYDLLFYMLAILLVVISIVSYQHIKHVQRDADETDRAYNNSLHLNYLSAKIKNAVAANQASLIAKDSALMNHAINQQREVEYLLQKLDSPAQQLPTTRMQLKELRSMLHRYFNLALPQQSDLAGQQLINNANAIINEMLATEQEVLSRTSDDDSSWLGNPAFPLMLGVLGLLIITLAYLKVRKEMLLREEAEKAAAHLENAQHLARETENRLLNLADAVPVLAWLCDAEGSFYFFNRQWLSFTNRSLEEEKGDGWLKAVHPEDVLAFKKGFEEAFANRTNLVMELRLTNKLGKYRWLALRAVPMFSADDSFLGYAGGSMDIEKQKNFARELEEKVVERTLDLKHLNDKLQLRNTIFAHAEETASIGSYSWHIESGNLEYSANFFKLLGYEPQEFTPTFEIFLSMIHPDDEEQVRTNGEKTAVSRTLFEDVYRIYTKQGEIRYFRSSGNFVGPNRDLLVGTVQDVTKDMMMKEVLTTQNLELERNNAELSSFTYIASHDLQEPLRKIQSFSRLIVQTETNTLSEKGKEYFERMDRAAGRMQSLIESLLNYSRINHAALNFVETDLNLLLAEVVADLGELIEAKKVIIKNDPLPTLHVMYLQFYQLFSNLIINSIKYSKEDVPCEISISAEKINARDVPGDTSLTRRKFWKIVFADNGIGFDAVYAEKVFELFQRLHGRTEYEGTGIGLAICRKIVNNHNGVITANGKLGIGAMFSIYIPEQK